MASLVKSLVPRSIFERALTEGHPYYSASNMINGTMTTNGNIGTFALPSLSRAFWIEDLVLSSNKQVDLQAQLANVYTSVAHVHRHVLYPGTSIVIPIRTLIRPTHLAAGSTSIGTLLTRTVLDGTATGSYIFGVMSGYSVYDDFNYGADKVILAIGDSIINGTAGITRKYNSYEWLLRQRYLAAGKNVRMINKSVSGTNSSHAEEFRQHGDFAFPQVDLLLYAMGVNDQAAAVSAATYQTNVAAMITHKQRLYPNAKMIVFGPTPAENNTTETQLVTQRTNAAAAVAAAADPNVFFCDLGSSFDRTNVANYAGTDPGGSHIHPSDAGHGQIDTVIGTFLAGHPAALSI